MKKIVKSLLCVEILSVLLYGNVLNVDAAGVKDIFNAKYYAEQYPDLKATFGSNEEALYQHFLEYGIKEGRVMNPVIDIVKYREQYGDLQRTFGNNWDSYVNHYFTYGVNEHRENGTDFNLLAYLEAYEDVKLAFGNNYFAIAKHYTEFGIVEGRNEGSKEFIEARDNEGAEVVHEDAVKEDNNKEDIELEDTSKDEVLEGEYTTYKEFFKGGSYIEHLLKADGNPVKSTYCQKDGTVISETEYTYNTDDILTTSKRVIMSNGEVTIDEYDEKGNLIKSTICDKDGNLYFIFESVFDEKNQKISTKKTYPDGTYLITERDENGHLVKETLYNADGTIAN